MTNLNLKIKRLNEVLLIHVEDLNCPIPYETLLSEVINLYESLPLDQKELHQEGLITALSLLEELQATMDQEVARRHAHSDRRVKIHHTQAIYLKTKGLRNEG